METRRRIWKVWLRLYNVDRQWYRWDSSGHRRLHTPNVCCGIWQLDVTARSFKSRKAKCLTASTCLPSSHNASWAMHMDPAPPHNVKENLIYQTRRPSSTVPQSTWSQPDTAASSHSDRTEGRTTHKHGATESKSLVKHLQRSPTAEKVHQRINTKHSWLTDSTTHTTLLS